MSIGFLQKHNISNLVDLLRYRAETQPNKTAYIFLVDGETEEAKITYGQLDARARAIATKLQKRFKPGERALLLYPSGLEFISAFFGCLYAGVIAAPCSPLDPRKLSSGAAKLRSIIKDCEPKLVLTAKEFMNLTDFIFPDYPDLEKMIWLVSEEVETGLSDYWTEPEIHDDSLAFLQYTSGSTNSPKGVMAPHGKLLYNAWQMQTTFGEGLLLDCHERPSIFPVDPQDFTHVTWLPLFHDMGLIANVLQSLFLGALCVLMSPQAFISRPLRWLQAISRYRARVSWAPNFAFELCVKKQLSIEQSKIDLSDWLIALNAAEPARVETIEKFYKTFRPYGLHKDALCVGYGLAEATIGVSNTFWGKSRAYSVDKEALSSGKIAAVSPDDISAYNCVSCGWQMPELDVSIVNPETFTRRATDEVGEIWLKGENITPGYWNNHTETKNNFQAYLSDSGEGPFLRTGDLGFMKDDELFVVGRLKDLIIIRGRNHYPQDIELDAAQSHKSLRLGCAAAFSVEVDNEEKLVVTQEMNLKGMEESDVDAAFEAIAEAVAKQHDLQVYAVVLIEAGTIPKTSSGKIQRGVCREKFLKKELKIIKERRQRFEKSSGLSADSDPLKKALKNIDQFSNREVEALLNVLSPKRS